MNKLLLFPLVVMMALAMILFLTDNVKLFGNGNDDFYQLSGEDEYNMSMQTPQNTQNLQGIVNLMGGSFTIFTGGIVIMGMGIVLSILAGLDVSVLGSGFKISENAQKMIFNVCIFGGLWIALTGVDVYFTISSSFTMIIYLVLSLAYCIGFAIQVTQVYQM